MPRISYDAELRRHNEALRRACGIQSRDNVLDIGCGAGQTTRQAAGIAQAGSALGIDVSAPAIERARALTQAEGLRNVRFERANAQDYRFPAERFDVAISRFGTMFFGDSVAAFANIRRALRPAGRLVMMVWQAHERNEWEVAIRQSLSAAEGPPAPEPPAAEPPAAEPPAAEAPAPPSGGADAFSLADPPAVTQILEAAGFAGVTFTDVREPVYYGPDVASALDWVRGFTSTSDALKRLDPAATDRALARLRAAMAAHLGDDGVWFNSAAWIVTAHRVEAGPHPPGQLL